MRNDPTQQQPVLVVLDANGDPASAKAVIDPNALDPSGKTTIDWSRTSPDGKLVAVSLSQNGSEIGTLHIYEVAAGKEIGEPIPRVQAPTAGGSLAWLNDSSGFWYDRYPGDEKPEADRFFYQQVYFHKLGSDWRSDPLVLGEKDGLPRVAEIFLGRDNTRDLIVASVQDGDGGEFAHFVLSKDGRSFSSPASRTRSIEVVSSPTGVVFALSRADAPNGKVLKLRPPYKAFGLREARAVVPESDVTTELRGAIVVTRTNVMVRDTIGGVEPGAPLRSRGVPAGHAPAA